MSSIRIVKGLPFAFLVKFKNGDEYVNVNDGTWNVMICLHYQTRNGPQPLALAPTASGDNMLITFTSEQTSELSHLGSGYVLITKASKIDDSVHIKTETSVSILNGL